MRRPLLLPVAVVVAVLLTGCSSGTDPQAGGRVAVDASFYPLAFLAERIGGEAVSVHNVTAAGGEPHEIELKASQVSALHNADLVLYISGFQPAIDKVVDAAKALDLKAPDLSVGADVASDPHIWLDPIRMIAMAEAITARLVLVAPAQAAAIRTRGAIATSELRALDATFTARLATCARREIVTSHEAFGHLARRYRLIQTGIAGVRPEEEPTAKRLAEVAAFVREKKVTTIFFETLVSPKLAETIARETGAKTAVLDPIEGVQPGSREDYLSIMRANLDALAAALGCR